MSDKVYEYNDKIYCDEDKSLELGDRWGGDLYDLYWELKEQGFCGETTMYYSDEFNYESYEDLLAGEFSEYEIPRKYVVRVSAYQFVEVDAISDAEAIKKAIEIGVDLSSAEWDAEVDGIIEEE